MTTERALNCLALAKLGLERGTPALLRVLGWGSRRVAEHGVHKIIADQALSAVSRQRNAGNSGLIVESRKSKMVLVTKATRVSRAFLYLKTLLSKLAEDPARRC